MVWDEAVGVVRQALEQQDDCCHAGSPRGVSDVYDYIPVPSAAVAAVNALVAAGVLTLDD